VAWTALSLLGLRMASPLLHKPIINKSAIVGGVMCMERKLIKLISFLILLSTVSCALASSEWPALIESEKLRKEALEFTSSGSLCAQRLKQADFDEVKAECAKKFKEALPRIECTMEGLSDIRENNLDAVYEKLCSYKENT
jgi:hypothetical protein